jgi:hypothetical protein
MTPKKTYKDGHKLYDFEIKLGIYCPNYDDFEIGVLFQKIREDEPIFCSMCFKELQEDL